MGLTINTRLLNRIFTILLNEMGSGHENLLYHTKAHWLSHGKMLKRAVKLRQIVPFCFYKKLSILNLQAFSVMIGGCQ